MADIKVGDRVRVTGEEYRGQVGVVEAVDAADTLYPYCVQLDGDSYALWVQGAEPETATSNDREQHVIRAKELLDGTHPTAGDILRMARFLAGEDE